MEKISGQIQSLLTDDGKDSSEKSIIMSTEDKTNFRKNSIFNIEYDLAQNIVRLTSVPLLEEIARTRFSISLWQQEDIRNEIARYDFFKPVNIYLQNDEWLPVKEKVIKKIDYLSLNTYFKIEILQKIEQIGEEIFSFLYFENERQYGPNTVGLDFNKKLIYMDHIHWNMEGTINKIKTVSNIIENTKFETLDKYILSCNYCLEEKIRFLLKKLPENFMETYFDEKKEGFHKYVLVYFWTHRIRRDGKFKECRRLLKVYDEFAAAVVNSNGKLLLWAIENVYEAAVAFIFENLNFSIHEDKGRCCFIMFSENLFAYRKKSLNIFCYLMLVGDWHYYYDFSECRAISLLQYLISDYKWVRDFFLPAAKYVLYELKIITYSDVLTVIIEYGNFEDNFVKFTYSEILALYPCDFSWFDTLMRENNLAWYVILGKDKEVVNFILSMCTPAERKKFIYSEDAMRAFSSVLPDLVELSWLDCLLQNIFIFDQEIKDFKKYVIL